MIKKNKKIHFFRLDMYTLGMDSKGNSEQKLFDVETKKKYLMDIVSHRLNENKAIKILKDVSNVEGPSATFEVIKDTESYIFGKLGKEQDINQFQVRKNDTLESQPISKGKDELFEAFSYVLIDKETFAVSYIKEAAAPSIIYLGYMITNIFRETDKVWGLVESLVDEDAIPFLSGKKIIGTLSYDLTLPAGYSKNITGLTEDEYKLLQNQKGTKVRIVLKAQKRKESVFATEEKARKFFNVFKNDKTNLKVSAKDENDDFMQEYRLIENPFSKKVSFSYNLKDQTYSQIQTQIENQLWLKYQQNKQSILKYIGFKVT